MKSITVVVIGGGAAGFFAALSCKQHHPDAEVIILEKSQKLLAKVKISGGGRCNVTNACTDIKQLAGHYPRGEMQLRKLFGVFNTRHAIEWFESRGVALKTYPDGCIFPESNNSQTIIDCFQSEVAKLGVKVRTGIDIQSVTKSNADQKAVNVQSEGFNIYFKATRGESENLHCDNIIVATGGHPKMEQFDWLQELGHKIEPPVPSLFTFNMPGESITKLMGVVVEPALVRVQGTNLSADGPLLITHWGMSGPAILRLSAWGARILADMKYDFQIAVSWVNTLRDDEIRAKIEGNLPDLGKKMVKNVNPFKLPASLWEYLIAKIEIDPVKTWGQLSKKEINRLANLLANDNYNVKGKTTFKEEFVTCGGVSLQSVDMRTLQSKVCQGMYFAGEVLDIDGITGGFNFQAAWSTGFIAGQLG